MVPRLGVQGDSGPGLHPAWQFAQSDGGSCGRSGSLQHVRLGSTAAIPRDHYLCRLCEEKRTLFKLAERPSASPRFPCVIFHNTASVTRGKPWRMGSNPKNRDLGPGNGYQKTFRLRLARSGQCSPGPHIGSTIPDTLSLIPGPCPLASDGRPRYSADRL